MLEKLIAITHGLNRKFPGGRDPFQILARLLEEGGELAQQVNHFEDKGVKRQKYGEPDRKKLAVEIKGVLLCAAQICEYYDLAEEVEASIELTYQRLKAEGLIAELDSSPSH